MNIILGISTGRSGTQSLEKLISIQRGVLSYHELWWKDIGDLKKTIRSINCKNSSKEYAKYVKGLADACGESCIYFFDIAPYTRYCVEDLKECFGNIRLVVLKRNFEDFKKSYDLLGKDNVLKQNKVIPFKLKEFYENIYKNIEDFNLPHFEINTLDLNNKDRIREMFSFLEIKEPNIRIFNIDKNRN